MRIVTIKPCKKARREKIYEPLPFHIDRKLAEEAPGIGFFFLIRQESSVMIM